MKYATKQIFEIHDIKEFYEIGDFLGNSFELRDDPSGLHLLSQKGFSKMIVFQYPNDELDKPITKNYIFAKELVINASNSDDATQLSSLVQSGCLLGYPSLDDFPNPGYVEEIQEENLLYTEEYYKKYYETFYAKEPTRYNLVLGCKIAAKTFGNLILMYCLEKYKFSLRLSSISPHSLHPRYGNMFRGYEKDYEFHVSGAHAFLSAYSIIEDLNIDIRSSSKNPRFIEEDGIRVMNPKVKDDLMNRLQNIGIDGDEVIQLVIRGEDSNLTELVYPPLGSKSEYSDLEDVYDIELTLIEAIHYCSYMRSYFFAHAFGKKNTYLRPYDVSNVQSLVRRLLLTHLGFWTGTRRKRNSEST